MPAINSSFDSLSFLSDSLREMLHRRLREIVGLALIVAALLLTAALASWSVQDPSLSHATVNPVRNLLGRYGAITADLMMQLLGVGALALVLPIAVWGWRLAGHRSLRREWLRVVIWIVGLLLAATFASSVPRTHGWPLPAGLGGVIGDGLLRGALAVVHAQLAGWERFLIAAATGAGAFVALAITCGLGLHGGSEPKSQSKSKRAEEAAGEEEEEESEEAGEKSEPPASIWLGWLVHGLLGIKWRLTRWLVRKRSGNVPIRPVAGRGRTEPRFENARRATLAPELD